MVTVAVAFWGAFFGTVSQLLVVALIAFSRSARRVAATASLSALMSGLFALVFLGWVPVRDPESLLRLQAHVTSVSAAVLGPFLLWTLGELREPRRAAHTNIAVAALLATVLAAGWALPAVGALALGTAMTGLLIAICLAASIGSALRGARVGWVALGGLLFLTVAVAGLTRHAFEPEQVDSKLQVVTAFCAIGYVTTFAGALWMRYSFLIALREAMVHGPAFDPVTRLRSRVETDAMVGDAFLQAAGERPLGVIVVSIANLMALEQLHGRSAYNHALFICASRLRRLVPPGVELGRLGEDAFLLLVRHPDGGRRMASLAHAVAARLARPVSVGISRDMAALEARRTEWVADIGVGVLVALPDMRPAVAVAGARAMSRTAWSYTSRVAWYDESTRRITELPLAPAGA